MRAHRIYVVVRISNHVGSRAHPTWAPVYWSDDETGTRARDLACVLTNQARKFRAMVGAARDAANVRPRDLEAHSSLDQLLELREASARAAAALVQEAMDAAAELSDRGLAALMLGASEPGSLPIPHIHYQAMPVLDDLDAACTCVPASEPAGAPVSRFPVARGCPMHDGDPGEAEFRRMVAGTSLALEGPPPDDNRPLQVGETVALDEYVSFGVRRLRDSDHMGRLHGVVMRTGVRVDDPSVVTVREQTGVVRCMADAHRVSSDGRAGRRWVGEVQPGVLRDSGPGDSR